MIDAKKLSDDQLIENLNRFVEDERERLHDFLAWLAEADDRGILVRDGHHSTFDYCVRKLRLSEDEAYRRIHAARATIVRPELLSAVADGRLTLSGVSKLAPHVEREDAAEIISLAEGKSARQIDELLAPLSPEGPKKETVRTIAVTRAATADNPHPSIELRVAFAFRGPVALGEAIRRIKELLAHKYPLGALEDVLLDVATDWLMRHDPLASYPDRKPAAPGRSAIPAAVRRRVWARDGGRCVFVGPGGTRCETRRMLELDHITPRALGGGDDLGNLRLLCRAHNDAERRRILGEGTGPTPSAATPGSP